MPAHKAVSPLLQAGYGRSQLEHQRSPQDFFIVCGKIQTFVMEVMGQGWFKKMLFCSRTEDDLAEMAKDLEEVSKNLCSSVTFTSLTILLDVKKDEERMLQLIGPDGPEALLKDAGRMQAFIGERAASTPSFRPSFLSFSPTTSRSPLFTCLCM